MTDRPLKPATHRCLGKPLPHQLANGTQTPPSAHKAFKYLTYVKHCYPVLALLSKSCPRLKGRLSTRYSPVRHFNHFRRSFLIRLACVKHAASVRSEPGSNSQVLILFLPIDSLLKYSPEGLRLARQAALSDKNVEELSYSKHINIKPHACLVNLILRGLNAKLKYSALAA